MRALAAAAALLLCSCAFAPAEPYVVEIKDADALQHDFEVCADHASHYHPGFDFRQVGIAAASGGLAVLPGAAISWGIVGLGVGQGAASATIAGLQLMPATQQKLLVQCLTIKGNTSGAYMVLDPFGS